MPISERDETAILVRKGLKIKGRHALRMKVPWKGPKAELEHKPRVFRWVGIQYWLRWKVLGDHVPFGAKARAEAEARLRAWLRRHPVASIIVGDQNEHAADMRERVAKGDAKVKGFGIDLAIFHGCRLVEKKKLGHHGSDHPGVLYVFEAKDKRGTKRHLRVIGWNVKVGHAPADVRKAIETWAKKYEVDVFVLTEAYGLHGKLSGLGFQVVQYAKKVPKKAKAKKPAKKPSKPSKPTVPVMGAHAIAAADTQSRKGPAFAVGMCLQRVRICFGIGAKASDAIGAWNGAQHKHRTTDAKAIPAGYPVFWSGGSASHGHIAISAGKGKCWSTDIRRRGYFDLVDIDTIHRQWGLTLLGYTGDLNGKEIS